MTRLSENHYDKQILGVPIVSRRSTQRDLVAIRQNAVCVVKKLKKLFEPLCKIFAEETMSIEPHELKEEAASYDCHAKATYDRNAMRHFKSVMHDHKERAPEAIERYLKELPPNSYEFVSPKDYPSLEKNYRLHYEHLLEHMAVNAHNYFSNFFPKFSQGVEASEFLILNTWEESIFPPSIHAPIGLYGAAFTLRLLKTTVLLMELVFMTKDLRMGLENMGREGDEANLINTYTARKNPLNSFYEGLASMKDAISLLLAEKLEGVEDGKEALRLVIESGLPAVLARKLPMGFLGPMNLHGYGIKGFVKMKEGTAHLDEEVMTNMSMLKKVLTREIQQNSTSDNELSMGYGCPVSRNTHGQENGIDALSKAFLYVFECLEEDFRQE